MRNIKQVLPFILWLVLSHANAQQQIILDDSKKFYGHENGFRFLVDKDKKFSCADLSNPEFLNAFKPATNKNFNFGLTSSAIWYQFTLVNKTGNTWLLQAGNPTVQEVTLYVPRANGECDSVALSLDQKISQRVWKNNNFLITISFPDSNRQIFFLRITSYHAMNIPPLIGTTDAFFVRDHYQDVWQGAYLGFILVMVLYNFFVFLSVRDISYLFYIFYMVCIGLVVSMHNGYPFDLFWPSMPRLNDYIDVLTSLSGVFAILFTMNFLHTRVNAPRIHKSLYVLMSLYILAAIFVLIKKPLLGAQMEQITSLIGALFVFSAVIYIYRKGYEPAKFYLIAWSVLLAGIVFFVLGDAGVIDTRSMNIDGLQIGSAGEALLLSFALANRINIYKKEKDDAQRKSIEVLTENDKLVREQNVVLEQKVKERTEELRNSQQQLVRSEKLASLGQLTAGIAHEIKNPLNFISNFSELSEELVEEANEAKTEEERKEILTALKNNLARINNHGRRAVEIVDSMLAHSRASTAEKELTSVNWLCEEYIVLAYQSFRASHRDFNCMIEKHLDPNLPKVNVVMEEISRVLLNLFNNAFHAVYEKQTLTTHSLPRSIGDSQLTPISRGFTTNYQPAISITTQSADHSIIIRVRDNGSGIPSTILEKIFEPFFTTKPTGQGTGLGLSISYEIILAHGGEMKVDSRENEFTEFIVVLPA